jgi:uncharacterized protein (TIGR02145 family)
MKKTFTLLVSVLFTAIAFSQSPERMSYQAVIRNASNVLVKSSPIGIKISILQTTSSGTAVYVETHSTTTNNDGLVTLEIGSGTVVTGAFSNINWSSGLYFLKTETDPEGGTNYSISGVSQILSVAYAFYAKTAGNVEAVLDKVLQIQAELGAKDVDGNTYKAVKIGTQVWMKENLKTTKYNDGSSIPYETNNTNWINLSTPAYCWYDNDEASNKPVYGALYNWYTVNTGKLCPTGWHIPSDAEWTILGTYLGISSLAGGKMKETGFLHWNTPNQGATNECGFTGLPGGQRTFGDGNFVQLGTRGIWWSSTEISSIDSRVRGLYYENSTFLSDVGAYGHKNYGFSVRCVKN